ncbi:MAG: toxin-antitoxin system HicB family antitoxin [Sulfuritalea sp.]|nr:toxin-antitoxin system HicB family antitoxin [Sulfuritalea sp.]
MATITVRLPDDKHQRLKALAKSRSTTLNRLFNEMATLMLAVFDAETRFQLRAKRGAGKTARGLALLKITGLTVRLGK